MNQTVWVIRVYDCGETTIDGVYATKESAIERADDLADYCGMEVSDENDCVYYSESGESIEVVEMDVL